MFWKDSCICMYNTILPEGAAIDTGEKILWEDLDTLLTKKN